MAKPKKMSSRTRTGIVGIDRAAGELATGTDREALQLRLLTLTSRALLLREGENEQEVVGAVLDALAAINPRDAFEGIMASQMIAVHETAMDCLRRAQYPDQSMAARDLNLKHAIKLLQLYVRQVEALDKHRGKGQQKITVEHVTVQAGGQAIVGHVDAAAVKQGNAAAARPQLEQTHELGASPPTSAALPEKITRTSATATPKKRVPR